MCCHLWQGEMKLLISHLNLHNVLQKQAAKCLLTKVGFRLVRIQHRNVKGYVTIRTAQLGFCFLKGLDPVKNFHMRSYPYMCSCPCTKENQNALIAQFTCAKWALSYHAFFSVYTRTCARYLILYSSRGVFRNDVCIICIACLFYLSKIIDNMQRQQKKSSDRRCSWSPSITCTSGTVLYPITFLIKYCWIQSVLPL